MLYIKKVEIIIEKKIKKNRFVDKFLNILLFLTVK